MILTLRTRTENDQAHNEMSSDPKENTQVQPPKHNKKVKEAKAFVIGEADEIDVEDILGNWPSNNDTSSDPKENTEMQLQRKQKSEVAGERRKKILKVQKDVRSEAKAADIKRKRVEGENEDRGLLKLR